MALETLQKSDLNALFNYLSQPKQANESDTFFNNRACFYHNIKDVKRISYKTLNDFRVEANMSFKELFEIITQTPLVIADNIQLLINMLSQISDNHKQQLIPALETMSYWWINDNTELPYRPSSNTLIYYAIARKVNPELPSILSSINSLQRAYADKKMYTRIDLADIPKIANNLGASLHWIFYPINNIYSSNLLDERIIDCYCAIEPIAQKSLMDALARMVDES